MMIVMAWLVHCTIIAAVLTAGAAAWELSARWSGRPARWAWLSALAGAVTLPWLVRLVPAQTWPAAVPSAVPVLVLDALVLSPSASSGAAWGAADVALAGWVLLSLLALAYVARLLLQLDRARRGWREADVDGGRVYVTRDTGPAALGVRRGVVVVPAWALELDAELRGLLLLHEREHVRAGDPRLLLGGLVLLAAMPWNPVLWFALLRLRNAIELDCDSRVLASGVSPTRYGSLLLEVGRRRRSSALVMATFAEPRMFLRARIERIAHWPLQRRPWRAGALSAVALALFATALSARDPLRRPLPALVQDGAAAMQAAAGAPLPGAAVSDTPPSLADRPVFTPMTAAPELTNRRSVDSTLAALYPPLLKDAGISGTATVWLFIDERGVTRRVQLNRTSGYPALDEAAVKVAGQMQFTPALNRTEKVPVWIEIPVVFKAPAGPLGTPAARADERKTEATRTQPPRAQSNADISAAPVFTPMTAAPELTNRREVERALIRNYPPVLRDAGIGGSPTVWFFIDEHGTVQRLQINKTSGYPALDQAALEVARTMRFTPALNRDRKVSVWVEIPIVFTAR